MQVITASRSEWIVPFTGLRPGQFRKLGRDRGRAWWSGDRRRPSGQAVESALQDRVLLVATYWRTNLTMRQIGPLFGVSHSAAHRVIGTVGPLLALAPVRKRRIDQVTIVDSTLVPTRDHRVAAPSKNYRYSTNLQVAIDADTRLVIATGDPQPGNRNDCTVYQESGIDQQLAGRPAVADGGYHGVPDVIIPFRKPVNGELTNWQEELNTVHRRDRARAEHAIGQMKTWKILRDYRRAAHTLADTASGNRLPPQHRIHRLTPTPASLEPPTTRSITRHHLA